MASKLWTLHVCFYFFQLLPNSDHPLIVFYTFVLYQIQKNYLVWAICGKLAVVHVKIHLIFPVIKIIIGIFSTSNIF